MDRLEELHLAPGGIDRFAIRRKKPGDQFVSEFFIFAGRYDPVRLTPFEVDVQETGHPGVHHTCPRA